MLLNQILLHIPCPVFWKNMDGVFLGCNKLFLEKFVGLNDFNQLIGKRDEDLPWKSYKDEYAKYDSDVVASGKTITRIESIPLITGTIISETTKAPLIENDKIIGILGICLDITDRLEKERLILENKAHQMEKQQQEKFINLITKLQQDIEAYKAETLTEKMNTSLKITAADSQINLTRRESQILYYLSLNKSVTEIANLINNLENKYISPGTIQSIINKQLYLKFGVQNISQLIDKATILKKIPFLSV